MIVNNYMALIRFRADEPKLFRTDVLEHTVSVFFIFGQSERNVLVAVVPSLLLQSDGKTFPSVPRKYRSILSQTKLYGEDLKIIFVIGMSVNWLYFVNIFPVKVYGATGVPKILNYQGRLLDVNENLLGGTGTDFCFKFSIYDDAVVGAPDNKLWPSATSSVMTINVSNGVFNTAIGDTGAGADALDFNFQDNDVAFLHIEVADKVGATCSAGDGAEVFETLGPRQRVGASGYAINADTVDGFHAAVGQRQSNSGSYF